MSEEYYKINAINSGSLAEFNIWDKNIRDEPEDKYFFWVGKCFEGVIREKYDKSYTLPYFAVENMNKRIVDAIIKDIDLDSILRYNKDGSVHKSDRDIEDQVEIIRREERSPIDKEDFDKIHYTVKNLLTMPVTNDLIVSDFLEYAEFDVPVYWEDEDGNKMKALFDIVSTLETGTFGESISLVFDLKYYANQYTFYTLFKNKLWVQERHYTRALKHYCREKGSSPYYCMPFLVGYKDSGLTQVNMIDDEFKDRAEDKYQDLVWRYVAWLEEGKKETGHLPTRYLKVY